MKAKKDEVKIMTTERAERDGRVQMRDGRVHMRDRRVHMRDRRVQMSTALTTVRKDWMLIRKKMSCHFLNENHWKSSCVQASLSCLS